MYISSLTLRNFRNFRSAKLRFKNGINTVIGENGSGKTNLFYALRLLIDDTLPRYSLNNFNSGDFSRSIGLWEGHWIVIGLEFADLDPGEDAQAMALHICGHMNVADRGSYALCFRPKLAKRQQLYTYSQTATKNNVGLREILSAITIEDYETVFLCRGTVDLSEEETYRRYVGDFENIVFPDPATLRNEAFGVSARGLSLHPQVSCTFIKALRDVESDLKSHTKNPLLNLLRGKEKNVTVANQADLKTDIQNLNQKISNLAELVDLKDGITSSINEAVGKTYAPGINITSGLPDDIDRLFQSLKLLVADAEHDGYHGKIWELSLGGANLIYLSLKLLEYERVKTDRIANFVLIEEPEAHVHTHIQKTLFENLPGKKTQVIVSTHSTHISSASKIGTVNILARARNESHVFLPSNNLTPSEVGRVERYLDAIRSTLLFAKGVVLVEGDAEMILIPEMFRAAFGISLDEIGVSLINVGSTEFSNLASLFHPDRIRKHCAILTDSDKSILTLSANPTDDTEEQKACRASENSGKERMEKLNAFAAGNDFLKLFFADHTFEVDFLRANNLKKIKDVLPDIYVHAAHVTRCETKLSDPSVEIAGKEVLRLADKVGKGWFALLLAEKLDFDTQIPPYILSAIAFASAHINGSCRRKAAKYRIEKFKSVNGHSNQRVAARFDVTLTPEETFINAFRAAFPNDTLTNFIGLL